MPLAADLQRVDDGPDHERELSDCGAGQRRHHGGRLPLPGSPEQRHHQAQRLRRQAVGDGAPQAPYSQLERQVDGELGRPLACGDEDKGVADPEAADEEGIEEGVVLGTRRLPTKETMTTPETIIV